FMARMQNTRPRDELYLRRPDWKALGLAAALAVLLLAPLAELAQSAFGWFPQQLNDPHPLARMLRAMREPSIGAAGSLPLGLLAYALVPAVCEEIAFRGLILTGLHRRFRART